MPAKVDDHWKDRLVSLKVNNASWGGVRLWQALQEDAKASGRSDTPSQGWVSKWLREDWPKVTEAERQGYRSFHWPENMERRDLPWEAGAAALELLGHLELESPGVKRPPIQFVRWFWRVSQIASGSSVEGRIIAATVLTSKESGGAGGLVQGVEWWLAYRPWESDANRNRYKLATSRANNPIPLMATLLPTSESNLLNVPGLRTKLESYLGSPVNETDVLRWTMLPDNSTRMEIRIRRQRKVSDG